MGSRQLRKASKGHALVVGGSMSGLLAALLLRRAGWDVDVFERVESELAGRGAGIVAPPGLIGTPRRLAGAFACPQVLTAWERVYRALRDAFPPERYHRRRGVKTFEQTDRFVIA